MKKYTAKQLTKYAEKLGFKNPLVWYSIMDGWWINSDEIEEYLGVWSSEAKKSINKLSESVFKKKFNL